MINWRVRVKNKTFWTGIISCAIALAYNLLATMDITKGISQNDATNTLLLILNVLAAAGVIHDPTTKGFRDSERALKYDEPEK